VAPRISSDQLFAHSASAVVAEIDGQMVALDIQRGVCYGLNKVATRIWQIIDAPSSAEQIADVLTTQFDVDRATCIAETLDLLADMSDAGLIVAPSEPATA
jgi:hypothetical protein